MEEKNSFLESVPAKFAFWAGVVTATAVISFVGLIATLYVVVTDNGSSSTSGTKTAAAADTGTADTAVAPTAAGTIDMDGLRHVRGEGEITIVEFSDTECPFCKQFHETMIDIAAEYDGKVRWAYKHFPLTSLHRKAHREAQATECAGDQGKFWEYTDLLFETTSSNDSLPDEELFTMAEEVGLDVDDFTNCLENGDNKDVVDADYAEAQGLGGTGTPFPVIVDSEGNVLQTVRGALPKASMQSLLDSLL